MVARVMLWAVLIGAAAGWAGIAAIGPLVRAYLFDPLALGAGGGVLLVLIAVCAAWWPARVAVRTDPAVILRAE